MENTSKITLKQIAERLKITQSKSKLIEGLKYYYYNKDNATDECIIACTNTETLYVYTDADKFNDEHGIESITDLDNL